jgi:prevent-host-death family protein
MYYVDDPDQLPELPDPGPRDGRHGVDRDADFNPYPAAHFGPDTGGDLAVSVPDAKWHLDFLLDRVEAGEEIIVMRHGHPVAMLVQPRRRGRMARAVSTSLTGTLRTATLRTATLRTGELRTGTLQTGTLQTGILPAEPLRSGTLGPDSAERTPVSAEELTVSETIVDTVSVTDEVDGSFGTITTSRSRTKTRTSVFPDEGDQLPELPDPGPRDGRHGVDKEDDDKPLYFPLSR